MRVLVALMITLSAAPAFAADELHPADRPVTSEEVEDYLKRKGLSPKALDSLPSPLEVLRYEQELKLTPAQRTKAQSLLKDVDRMAETTGKELVKAEKELTRGDLDTQQERALTRRIESLESEMRWTQQSFGEMLKAVLSPSQAKQLEELEARPAGETSKQR